jgi:hypothetical protein
MCTVTSGYVFGIFIPLFFQNAGKKQAHEVVMFSVPTSVFVPADHFSLNFEQFAAGGHTIINISTWRTWDLGGGGFRNAMYGRA